MLKPIGTFSTPHYTELGQKAPLLSHTRMGVGHMLPVLEVVDIFPYRVVGNYVQLGCCKYSFAPNRKMLIDIRCKDSY